MKKEGAGWHPLFQFALFNFANVLLEPFALTGSPTAHLHGPRQKLRLGLLGSGNLGGGALDEAGGTRAMDVDLTVAGREAIAPGSHLGADETHLGIFGSDVHLRGMTLAPGQAATCCVLL